MEISDNNINNNIYYKELTNKCRACESQVNLYELFENTDNLLMKFTLCTSLKVNLDDQLPKFICRECLNELNIAYIFRIKCENTQHKLNTLLKKLSLNNEVKLEVDYEIYTSKIENNCYNTNDNSANNNNKIIEDTFEVKLEECSFNSNIKFISNELADIKDNYTINTISYEDEDDNNKGEEEDTNDESVSSGSSDMKKKNTYSTRKFAKTKVSYTCQTCGVVYSKYNELIKHNKSHGVQRFQCKTCDKWFRRYCDLKVHENNHTGLLEYKCEECDKNFTRQCNLDRHIKSIHNNEKLCKCEICGSGFKRSSSLRQHLYAEHKDSLNYECDICLEKFSQEIYLQYHKKRHDSKRIKPVKESKEYICHYCGQKSLSISQHQIHERTHTGERPFECNVCSKKFICRPQLRTHMLIHTGEKPYKCIICSKAFRQRQHLKSHIVVHTGEKHHKCFICDKTFTVRSSLNVHMKSHSGRRPQFKCTTCDKSFTVRSSLNVHLRSHTGETPYHCNICPQKFSDIKYLKRHLLIHLKNQIDANIVNNDESNLKLSINNFVDQNVNQLVSTEQAYSVNEFDVEPIVNMNNSLISGKMIKTEN